MAGQVLAIAPEGAGVRAAVVDSDRGGAAIEHLDASARRVGLTRIVPWGSPDASAVLTPSGAVVIDNYESKLRVRVRAAMLDHGKVRQQFVSGSRYGELISPLAAGPTGAVGAVIVDVGPNGARPSLVFRPAGARRFQKPVPIATRGAAGDSGLVVLGPDGGGVVLSLPDRGLNQGNVLEPTNLRRISPSGHVGPQQLLKLGVPGGGQNQVEASGTFLTDGSFAAVFSATNEERVSPFFVHWGRLAEKPSPPQRLSTYRIRYGSDPVPSIVATPHGGVVALVDKREQTPRLYEGRGATVRPAGALPTYAAWTGLQRMVDGRLIAYGQGQDGFYAVAAEHPATTPAPLFGSYDAVQDYNDGLIGTGAALPDGRLALPWTTDDGQVGHLLLATPAVH